MRPAVIVSNESSNQLDNDYLVCPLTSTLRNIPFSYILTDMDVDSPLPVTSEVRCNKVFTARNSLISGKLTSRKSESTEKVIASIYEAIKIGN